MSYQQTGRLAETAAVASVGGGLFYLANLPLPWVLGALTFVMLWQGFTHRKSVVPPAVKNIGFMILGMSFGLYFTAETFQTIIPYFLPFLLLTCILILFCIFLGIIVTRWIKVDQITSVFSSIPGGLSEMAIASEALNARPALVVIFQTMRLLTVLFTLPAAMTFIFADQAQGASSVMTAADATSDLIGYLWFIIPAGFALLIRNKLPAGIIIGALGVTALLNVSPVELSAIPAPVLAAAQIVVGASLGKNILFRELRIGGKYCFVYLGLSIVIVAVSAGLGVLLANVTSLSYMTAILSLAPGGLFEMVLTASEVGGNPAIVSALQLTRILLIVTCVPPLLAWYFNRKARSRVA